VSTISTKSHRKKQQAKAKKDDLSGPTGQPGPATEISEGAWRISALAILVVGTFLRLIHLTLVPLHHDEGVNGNFLVTLVREHAYTYNPENYHGPTLYYFSALIPWIVGFFGGKAAGDKYGLTTFNIRLVTVIFGVGTIWLVLLLRDRIGTIGTLAAAGLIAISPGAIYLSRYFIHESLFVFFTLGVVVACLKYYDTGRAVYAILAGISASLMVATKETWIINGPVLLIALLSTTVYFLIRDRLARGRGFSLSGFRERFEATIDRLGGPIQIITISLIVFAVFVLVAVVFYSSFFTNYPKGVSDGMKTLNLWRNRTHEHAHPFLQYFEWLRQMESPILLLGAAGAAVAVWRADNRLALFVGQWAFGSLVAYSLVEYKTPWISLNFIVPLAIVAGYGVEQLYRRRNEPWLPLSIAGGAILFLVCSLISLKRDDHGSISGVAWDFDFSQHWPVILAMVGLALYAGFILYWQSERQSWSPHVYLAGIIVLIVCGYQMYQLNFVHYDDDRYAYVYAHTHREMLALVDEVEKLSTRMGTGTDTGIAIVSPDYWPLPWYLRDYKRVGYYPQIVPTNEPLIIGSRTQEEQLKMTYSDRYVLLNSGLDEGAYGLRPGVDLLLYVRNDVAK
jgi:uncharacterized protein (TIGR03663 family)